MSFWFRSALVTIFSLGACTSDLDPPNEDCAEHHIAKVQRGLSCGGVTPPTPDFSGIPIDPPASYDEQSKCDPTAKPGVVAFRDMLLGLYPCTTNLGIIRACDVGGTSEHKEGRAFDWGVTPDNQAAWDVIDWLLAKDSVGNDFAMARRLGLMYMVFDSKIWGAYRADEGWRPYNGASPHTDHVHFSFSRDGATKLTSYWQGKPAPDGSLGDASLPTDGNGPLSDAEVPHLESGPAPGDLPPSTSLPPLADDSPPVRPRSGCALLNAFGPCDLPATGLLVVLFLARLLPRRRPRSGARPSIVA
jgi:hypothetical protein